MSPAEIDAARKLVETYSAAGAREMPRVLTAALDALVAEQRAHERAAQWQALAEAATATHAAEQRALVLRAVEWRAGEWLYLWDEGVADAFRAWGEAMAAERDAARGVAQLAVEEAAALRKQLGRAQDELDAYRDAHRGRATP